MLGHALGLVDEHMRFDRFRNWVHGQNRSELAKSNVLARRPNFPVKVRQKIYERFIKINNIYAFDDFQQQLVTRIPPNEKLDTPFGYNHLSIMQYSSYSQGSMDLTAHLGTFIRGRSWSLVKVIRMGLPRF